MDFAKQQLLKFGWSEGKGLGKNEDGISEALKPKLKFDTSGVGHDRSEQFTFNWWENVYNNAADNITVKKSKTGDVSVARNSADSVDITTKKFSLQHLKKKHQGLEYGSFVKTAKLTADGIIDCEDKSFSIDDQVQVLKTINLTDEELFAACEGRTAHKGARHGHNLNGKLSRIEHQEKMLMQQYEEQKSKENKCKKKNKEDTLKISIQEIAEIIVANTDENQPKKMKKKKNKDKICPEIFKTETSTESDTNQEVRKRKKKRKRQHSHTETENEIEEEAASKRYDYYCNKQSRKKLHIKRRQEEKTFSKISQMLENCMLDNQPKQENSEDDGFDESIKKKKIKLMASNKDARKEARKLKKKKKKKKLEEEARENAILEKSSEDDGFVDLMNEISDKLARSKDIRKKLRYEKKRLDDKRISRISEELDRVCTV